MNFNQSDNTDDIKMNNEKSNDSININKQSDSNNDKNNIKYTNVEGSDMTRDIHIAFMKEDEELNPLNRPSSKSLPDIDSNIILYEDIPKASDIAQPGGFRRDFLLDSSNISNYHDHQSYIHKPFMEVVAPPLPYSYFKSIQLASHNLELVYDDFIFRNFEIAHDSIENDTLLTDETFKPLIPKSNQNKIKFNVNEEEINNNLKNKNHLIELSLKEQNGSSIKKTIFTILKSFIGSGILFLPKGFQNGGLLFSLLSLSFCALLSTICMLRLSSCAKHVQKDPTTRKKYISYGHLGYIAYGNIGKIAVNISIILSQLGFCCSYLIFIQSNFNDIILHIFECKWIPNPLFLILIQIPLYTPLTWIRKIKYFAITNLIADLLILFVLLYIMTYSFKIIEQDDVKPVTIKYFNKDNWSLFLGTAVFVFEGIGLVLPIYDAMDKSIRHHFNAVLSKTILFLLIFFSSFASLVYLAFGEETLSVVTLNLPNSNPVAPRTNNNKVNGGTVLVQLCYSVALIFTYPLMFYPALMIIESYFYPKTNVSPRGEFRWQKNIFRFFLVFVTALISYAGSDQLDNFVAIIGGLCSVPLAFIYPSLFHSKIKGTGRLVNDLIFIFGIFTMVFVTYESISKWGCKSNSKNICTAN